MPWNSMELLVSAKLAHFEFHGIPWNLFLLFNGTIGIINTLSFKFVLNSVEFEFANFGENDIHFCRMN